MVEAACEPLAGSQKLKFHSYYSSRTRVESYLGVRVVVISLVAVGNSGSGPENPSIEAQICLLDGTGMK